MPAKKAHPNQEAINAKRAYMKQLQSLIRVEKNQKIKDELKRTVARLKAEITRLGG